MKEDPNWAYSFEDLFQNVDNSIRETIDFALEECGPIGRNYKEALGRVWRVIRGHKEYSDFARKFVLEKDTSEKLFLIIISLLIRSPANIDRLARYPMAVGMPRSESIGKINLHHQTQNWLTGSDQKSSFQFFVFLFAQKEEFIFGDGLFDEITARLQGGHIGKDCLVPLTPKLAVFCFGVSSIHNGINAASLVAKKSIVNYVNEITQIYAKDKIYYSSKKPQISAHYKNSERLAVTGRRESFFEDLKTISWTPYDRHQKARIHLDNLDL